MFPDKNAGFVRGRAQSSKALGNLGQRSSGERMGRGLFLSRALLEAQGGKMWLENREGEEPILYVSLPRGEPAA